MTVGELFNDVMSSEYMFDEQVNKAMEIAYHQVDEGAAAVDRLQDILIDKYGYEDDDAEVSESDVNDLEIARQALMNSLCMYFGSLVISKRFENKEDIMSIIDDQLGAILTTK